MSSGRLIALSATVLAVAALLAGCGGGDEDSQAASLSKPQFIAKADAICRNGSEQVQNDLAAYLEENNLKLNENQTEEESAAFINEILVPNLEGQVDDIGELGVPGGDEEQIEEILDALVEGIERAEEDPEAVVQGEVDLFGQAGELAREYGLKACAQQ